MAGIPPNNRSIIGSYVMIVQYIIDFPSGLRHELRYHDISLILAPVTTTGC